MNQMWTKLSLALLISSAGLSVPAEIIVGVAFPYDEPSSPLFHIDSTTGIRTKIGPTGFSWLNSLTRDAAGNIYSLSGADLIKIDPATGLGKLVTHVQNFGDALPDARGLAMSPNGDLFAISPFGRVGFLDGDTLWRINAATGDTTWVGPTGFGAVQSLEFGPDGNLYGVSLFSGGMVLFDQKTGKGTLLPGEPFRGSQSIAFAPDGSLYAVGTATALPLHDGLFKRNESTGAFEQIGPDYLYPAGDLRGIVFVVPEPPTAAILILGLTGLLLCWRRQRNKRPFQGLAPVIRADTRAPNTNFDE